MWTQPVLCGAHSSCVRFTTKKMAYCHTNSELLYRAPSALYVLQRYKKSINKYYNELDLVVKRKISAFKGGEKHNNIY